MYLADFTNNVENSSAASSLGALLLYVILGFLVLFYVGKLAKRVEGAFMPGLPMIVGAMFVGLLFIGMLHHIGLF